MITEAELDKANELVERGAEYLDRLASRGQIPVHWRSKISIVDLDIENCSRCVLGQLFGDFCWGDTHLSENFEDYQTYLAGFNYGKVSASALNEAWVKEIQDQSV